MPVDEPAVDRQAVGVLARRSSRRGRAFISLAMRSSASSQEMRFHSVWSRAPGIPGTSAGSGCARSRAAPAPFGTQRAAVDRMIGIALDVEDARPWRSWRRRRGCT